MAITPATTSPRPADRPAGWWCYPFTFAVVAWVAPMVTTQLGWGWLPVIGVVAAVLGLATVRALWPARIYGELFTLWALLLAGAIGAALTGWLLLVRWVEDPFTVWQHWLIGSAVLGGWWAILAVAAPAAAAAHLTAPPPMPDRPDGPLGGVFHDILLAAQVIPGARIVEMEESPSGGVVSVHLRAVPPPPGAPSSNMMTFQTLVSKLPRIAAHADDLLDADIDDDDVSAERSTSSRWIVHFTVKRVLTGEAEYPIRETPRPVGEPSRIGRYETDKPILLQLFDLEQGASHLDLVAGTGGGKALDVATPIPTPTGWTTMGELRAGDQVLDEQGRPCTVLEAHAVRYDRPCYQVMFSDGEQIVADAEHLWFTEDRAARRARWRGTLKPQSVGRVRNTEEIAATLRTPKGYLNHTVPVAAPLQLPERDDLLVAPYVLGVWLGDGSHRDGRVTTADGAELRALLAAEGYETGHNQASPERTETFRVLELRPQLRKLGVLRDSDESEKHIPAEYLRAGERQRRDLLAGLLDTDGTVCGHGRVQFDSTSERLARDVHELALSLGYRATIWDKDAKLNGRVISRVWRVSFTSADPVFRLTRKLAAQAARTTRVSRERNRNRFITAVDPVPTRPVRCITVDSPSRLYLAGRAMVPTHNTTCIHCLIAEDNASDAWEVWVFSSQKLTHVAWPWIRPWVEGHTDRPPLDAVFGESQDRILVGLAWALQLAVAWNRTTDAVRVPVPRKAGLTVAIDESSDCLRNRKKILFRLGAEMVLMDASQIVAKLAEIARTSPVKVVRASQYGLFDSAGSAGAESRRNFLAAIVGKVTRPSDANNVAPSMPPGWNATRLTDNMIYVQPNLDIPTVLRAKAYALYKRRVDPVAIAYAKWRNGLDPAFTGALQGSTVEKGQLTLNGAPAYADRWAAEHHPELKAFAANENRPWPAGPATTATPLTGADRAPTIEPTTPIPPRQEDPMPAANQPADDVPLPTGWADEEFDVWAMFEERDQPATPADDELPDVRMSNGDGSVLANPEENLKPIKAANAKWRRQIDVRNAWLDSLRQLPEPLGKVLRQMEAPQARKVVETGWVPTEMLAMVVGYCELDADEASRRKAVAKLGWEINQITGLTSREIPRPLQAQLGRRAGWQVDELRDAAKRLIGGLPPADGG